MKTIGDHSKMSSLSRKDFQIFDTKMIANILTSSLTILSISVSPISTFSTAVLNNDESNKALYANSNVASDGASNVAPDLGEGAVGPEEVGAELEREPQSADSLTSDGKNEATEQLPVPQAASVGKTA